MGVNMRQTTGPAFEHQGGLASVLSNLQEGDVPVSYTHLDVYKRQVVAKAKANNMPNDNISRSIAKASGELGNVSYEEIVYEGYGNGGVALMVETLTDNRNRTASDVRHLFDKFGNGLGTTGCVSYMFCLLYTSRCV